MSIWYMEGRNDYNNQEEPRMNIEREHIEAIVEAAVNRVVEEHREIEHNRKVMAPTEEELEEGANQLLGLSKEGRADADVESAANYLISYSGSSQSNEEDVDDAANELLSYLGKDK